MVNFFHFTIFTARIRRMREGNSFSLSVSSHLGGGVPTFRIVREGYLLSGLDGGGGYLPSQVRGGGVPTLRSGWGGVPTFPGTGGGGTYSGLDGGYLPR